MPRDRRMQIVRRVDPDIVIGSVRVEHAAVLAQMLFEVAAFHRSACRRLLAHARFGFSRK